MPPEFAIIYRSHVDTSCWAFGLARWLRALVYVLPKCEFDFFSFLAFCDVFVDAYKRIKKKHIKKRKKDETNKKNKKEDKKNGDLWKKCIWVEDAKKDSKNRNGFKNKSPRSAEFNKMFCVLAGWLCWLCLPCCAAGEFNVSTSKKTYSMPEITTSVILGQLDALPGPPRAPIDGLVVQPWVQLHGDVIKDTLSVADVAWADFAKLCFSIAVECNAKGLGCQTEIWHCEGFTPKFLWGSLFVSGIGGAFSLFKFFGWFSRVWGFDFLPFISLGIAVANIYVGFWILDTDGPFFNFLYWIVWGIVGVSWPVRSDVTCLAYTARPRKTGKKKKTKRKGKRNETDKRLHVDPFGFHGSLLCKKVCIATKVGSVRHKGSRGKRGSRVKIKGLELSGRHPSQCR